MRASPKRGNSGERERDLGEDLLDNRVERGCVLGYHALRPWPTLLPPPVHVGQAGLGGLAGVGEIRMCG